MEITVKHESRAKAVQIANTIADVSIIHGRLIMQDRSQRALIALDDELAEQAKFVEENRKQLALLIPRDSHKLAETNEEEGTGDTEVQMTSLGLIELSLKQAQYHQAKEAYEQSRTMLHELKIKQEEARVLLKMPRDPVTLHEAAK